MFRVIGIYVPGAELKSPLFVDLTKVRKYRKDKYSFVDPFLRRLMVGNTSDFALFSLNGQRNY